jgi:uncharacterized damage-inducible protein DinB
VHPRLLELVSYADAQREVLLASVSRVPEPLRERRAESGTWSVAEVLEHLHRVERGIARLLAHALQRARAEGIGPELETGSMMGSLDRFHIASRTGSINAPEPVRPRGKVSAVEALAGLAESRRALRTELSAWDGLALGTITHSHPLLGPLNLYQWVLFVGQHEARHAAQIHEIAGRLQVE